jgi:hypothetical protein
LILASSSISSERLCVALAWEQLGERGMLVLVLSGLPEEEK